MKKFISIIGLGVSLLTAQAQLFTSQSNLAATNTAVITTPLVLEQMTLFSTNTTPTLVFLYDGAITNVTAAYTNYIQYPTNVVTTYTNTTGTTNTLTNRVEYTLAVANAAATNNSSPIRSLVVPASGSVTVFTETIPFAQKLTISNNLAGLSAVIRYRKP
jgi:hypothetical protein